MARKRKGDIDAVDPEGNFIEGESVLISEPEEAFPESTEETEAVREKIKSLTKFIGDGYWELSQLVWRVNKERLYKTWGYPEFSEWASEEMGFQKRKAYYLVQFQDYCENDLRKLLPSVSYNNAVDQLKEVGWSKALELAKSEVLTPENYVQILEEAKTDKIDELVDKLKLIKTNDKLDKENGVTENTMKKVKRSFNLTTSQEELLQNALEKAKSAINRDDVSPEFALEYMAGDFLANCVGNLAGSLSQIERIHNVAIVAFADNKNVVFGEDTLRAISQEVGAV